MVAAENYQGARGAVEVLAAVPAGAYRFRSTSNEHAPCVGHVMVQMTVAVVAPRSRNQVFVS